MQRRAAARVGRRQRGRPNRRHRKPLPRQRAGDAIDDEARPARVVEVLQLARASARMEAAAEDAVRTAFPDVDAGELSRMTAADIARTRIERLRGGAQSSDFLRLVASIAPAIHSKFARLET